MAAMMARRPWTAAEDAELLRRRSEWLRRGGRASTRGDGYIAAAAAALGRSEMAVRVRVHVLQDTTAQKRAARPGLIRATPGEARHRFCLRCRCRFISTSRHNFICDPCKASSAWRDAVDGNEGSSGIRIAVRDRA
jgi:hypothetical protein